MPNCRVIEVEAQLWLSLGIESLEDRYVLLCIFRYHAVFKNDNYNSLLKKTTKLFLKKKSKVSRPDSTLSLAPFLLLSWGVWRSDGLTSCQTLLFLCPLLNGWPSSLLKLPLMAADFQRYPNSVMSMLTAFCRIRKMPSRKKKIGPSLCLKPGHREKLPEPIHRLGQE